MHIEYTTTTTFSFPALHCINNTRGYKKRKREKAVAMEYGIQHGTAGCDCALYCIGKRCCFYRMDRIECENSIGGTERN